MCSWRCLSYMIAIFVRFHLQALQCLQAIKRWQDSYNSSQDVIPLSFWRDPRYLLLTTQRQRRSGPDGPAMTPVSQRAFVERILAELLLQKKAGVCQIMFANWFRYLPSIYIAYTKQGQVQNVLNLQIISNNQFHSSRWRNYEE